MQDYQKQMSETNLPGFDALHPSIIQIAQMEVQAHGPIPDDPRAAFERGIYAAIYYHMITSQEQG